MPARQAVPAIDPQGLPIVASGPIARADAGRYLDLADILAWPQPDEGGAAGGLLEAMARGAVLAASDIARHRELLLHGSNGILFEAGHAGAIVEALGALLDEPACWPRLREGARRHAEREFGPAACAARFAPAYARLLGAG
jgi:glycosyltransferase involved in cell wall biosynthesis